MDNIESISFTNIYNDGSIYTKKSQAGKNGAWISMEKNKKSKGRGKEKTMAARIKTNIDVIIASAVFISVMMTCALLGINLVLPLIVGFFCYAAAALKQGYSVKAVARMAGNGLSESMLVVITLLMIGMISAAWRASGTIAMFVHYGIAMITPNMFLLIAFLLCCVFSYAMGSSFGVAGTIGIILVTIAKAGDVSIIMTAGAVLSGGYFGDRFSPVSSSANLTAFITKTEVYDNMKKMARTMIVPLMITIGMYAVLSMKNPLGAVDPAIDRLMLENFTFSPLLLIPVLVMIVLPLFHIKVRVVALISTAIAAVMAVAIQGEDPLVLMKTLLLGYDPEGAELAAIFAGGGMISMGKVSAMIAVSCAYSEIIKQTHMFRDVVRLAAAGCERFGRAEMTLLTGTMFSGLFCSQSVAILMNGMILKSAYRKTGGMEEMAIDIENTTVLSATWAPWSSACMAVFSVLGAGSGALAFSFFVFVLPVYYLLSKHFVERLGSWYNAPGKVFGKMKLHGGIA